MGVARMATGWLWTPSRLANVVKVFDPPDDEIEKTLMEAETCLSKEVLEGIDKEQLTKWRARSGSERKRSDFYIQFRAKLGEKAHHFKTGSRAGEWVAATVDWAWAHQQRKLSGPAYNKLGKLAQHMYDQERKVRERQAKVVRRAHGCYEEGKFSGLTVSATEFKRMPGAGCPVKFVAVEEALYDYFLASYIDLRGRVPAALLRAKALQLFQHYQGAGGDEELPEDWRGDWLTKRLERWRERFQLAHRAKNRTYELSYEEYRRRLGFLWRTD